MPPPSRRSLAQVRGRSQEKIGRKDEKSFDLRVRSPTFSRPNQAPAAKVLSGRNGLATRATEASRTEMPELADQSFSHLSGQSSLATDPLPARASALKAGACGG